VDTQFFGPRDIAIDGQGRLLVTDTGNKRVQAFDTNGNFIGQFGGAGAEAGQFNEPVGLAVDDAGNLYVADTWNKRIQVFDSTFKFLREFPVAEWAAMPPGDLQNVDHKPYLAIQGNTLFVSSPRTSQVLGFTLQGTPVQLPGISFDASALPTGLRVNINDLFVTDAASGEVKSFILNAGGMR
jgi:DNA-binding beta-propeller fold protein YncE